MQELTERSREKRKIVRIRPLPYARRAVGLAEKYGADTSPLSRSIPFLEHLFGRKQPVQRRGESGIDCHLYDDFDDLLPGAADVERPVNVHFQLGDRIAERRERGDNGDLAGLEIEAGRE